MSDDMNTNRKARKRSILILRKMRKREKQREDKRREEVGGKEVKSKGREEGKQ